MHQIILTVRWLVSTLDPHTNLDTDNRRCAASLGDYSFSGFAGTFFWIDPVLDVVAMGMIQVLRSPLRLSTEMKNLVHGSLITDEN